MTGHLLGAAGAIEAILAIKSINENIIPPTINIQNLNENIPEEILSRYKKQLKQQ